MFAYNNCVDFAYSYVVGHCQAPRNVDKQLFTYFFVCHSARKNRRVLALTFVNLHE